MRSQSRSATVVLVPGMIARSGCAEIVGALDVTQAHGRLGGQRGELVEVGDARQPDHGDVDGVRSPASALAPTSSSASESSSGRSRSCR